MFQCVHDGSQGEAGMTKGIAMTHSIRQAGGDDLDDLAELFDAYRQFYGQAPDIPAAHDFLAERMAREESVVFVAALGPRAVGFTQLYPLFSSVRMRRLWLLNDLFVAGDMRRGGVASALLNAAHEHARASGAAGVMLETGIENRQAQALYAKLGYRRNESTWFYEFPLA